MKVIIVLSLLSLSLAELNTYIEFKEYSLVRSMTLADYAVYLGFKDFAHQFNKFKIEHNRNFESQEEEEQRKFNFLKTLQFVEKHNQMYKKGDLSHEVGITLFADKSGEEYEQLFSIPSPLDLKMRNAQDYFENISDYASLPASFDWRQHGKVTSVKDQKGCGSCWAFTTTSMVESGYLIHYNKSLSLSEQQLVDCLNSSCHGVYIDTALSYVKINGLENEEEYPYQSQAFACRNEPSKFHAHIKGYHTMARAAGNPPVPDELIMTTLMSNGPIGFILDAFGDDFEHYRRGVLTTGSTQWIDTHAMTLVGWGTQRNIPYWIIKNSFGPTWGEDGYLKLARGKNLRGINEYLYYPIF